MGPSTKKIDIFGTFLGGAPDGAGKSAEMPHNLVQEAEAGNPPPLASQLGGGEAEQIEQQLLEQLNKAQGTDYLPAATMFARAKGRPTQIVLVLRGLETAGLVESSKRGNDLKYRLTALGRALASSGSR